MTQKICKVLVSLVVIALLITIGAAAFYFMFPSTDVDSIDYPDFSPKHKSSNFFTSECGRADNLKKRIQYGTNASLGDFPCMVALFYNDTSNGSIKFGCGGSLIDKKLVLTAAHCINKNLLFIRLGEYDLSTEKDCITHSDGQVECADPVQDIYSFTTIIHSEFQFNNHSDIALIKLNEVAKVEQNNIKTICLPNDSNLPQSHSIQVIGFGYVGFEAITHPHQSILQLANMIVYTNDNCESEFKKHKFSSQEVLSSKLFCARGKNETLRRDITTCRGDSGGPAMHLENGQFVQVGIVSAGGVVCGIFDEVPSIFVKVFDFLDWIEINSK